MWLDLHIQDQVAALTTSITRFAFARDTNFRAFTRSCRNTDSLLFAGARLNGAFAALKGFFQRDLDTLFDVITPDRLSGAFASARTTAKERGKEVGKIAQVFGIVIGTIGLLAVITPVEATWLSAHALPLLIIRSKLVILGALVGIA